LKGDGRGIYKGEREGLGDGRGIYRENGSEIEQGKREI